MSNALLLALTRNDIADYVSHNDLGTAIVFRALARTGFPGRLVLASSMVVYGEGAYACPEHGPVRPAARAVADLTAGRFEPPCPACGEPLVAGLVGGGDGQGGVDPGFDLDA